MTYIVCIVMKMVRSVFGMCQLPVCASFIDCRRQNSLDLRHHKLRAVTKMVMMNGLHFARYSVNLILCNMLRIPFNNLFLLIIVALDPLNDLFHCNRLALMIHSVMILSWGSRRSSYVVLVKCWSLLEQLVRFLFSNLIWINISMVLR